MKRQCACRGQVPARLRTSRWPKDRRFGFLLLVVPKSRFIVHLERHGARYVALHNFCVTLFVMNAEDQESVATYIRSLGLDNFAVSDEILRLGNRLFNIDRCGCGGSTCDGWKLVPLKPR